MKEIYSSDGYKYTTIGKSTTLSNGSRLTSRKKAST